MRTKGDRIRPSLRVVDEHPPDSWLWKDSRIPRDLEHLKIGYNIVPYLELFAYRRIPNYVHLMEMYEYGL